MSYAKSKYVYFMRPIGMDGPIKIGSSSVPGERLETLSVWSPFPLEIIGAVPGTYADEQFLHRVFASQHLHREWFRYTPELAGCIDKILCDGIEPMRSVLTHAPGVKRVGRKDAWTPERRLRTSYSSRIRHLQERLRKKDALGQWYAPDDVCTIMNRWSGNSYRGLAGTPPTASELARLDQYLADPLTHSVVPSWLRDMKKDAA